MDEQLDLDSATKKKASKKEKAGEGAGARGARRAARGGRREDQGAQLLHRDRHAPAQGLPRQPVPGGGRARLRRLLAGRQADRAVPLREPRAAPVPARRVRDDRGDRQDRLAQLPPVAAEGLAAGRPDGAHRPHRVGLGAVHLRGEGGGGALPGDHRGRSQLAAQECGRKLAAHIRKKKHADYQAQRRSASSSSTSRRSPRRSARSPGRARTRSSASSCGWPRR